MISARSFRCLRMGMGLSSALTDEFLILTAELAEKLKCSVLRASVIGERNRTMVINPSPRLPKGKGAPFSLGALVAHMQFAFMLDTHPRGFPKGRERPSLWLHLLLTYMLLLYRKPIPGPSQREGRTLLARCALCFRTFRFHINLSREGTSLPFGKGRGWVIEPK